MIKGLERLKELSMFSLEKRRLGGGEYNSTFQTLEMSEEGQDLFLIIPECWTGNNGFTLQDARFWLNILYSMLEQYENGPIISGGAERCNTGGIQETIRG